MLSPEGFHDMMTERQKDRLRTFPIRVQWLVNEYAGRFFFFLMSSSLMDIYAILGIILGTIGVLGYSALIYPSYRACSFAHNDARNSVGRLASGQTFDPD